MEQFPNTQQPNNKNTSTLKGVLLFIADYVSNTIGKLMSRSTVNSAIPNNGTTSQPASTAAEVVKLTSPEVTLASTTQDIDKLWKPRFCDNKQQPYPQISVNNDDLLRYAVILAYKRILRTCSYYKVDQNIIDQAIQMIKRNAGNEKADLWPIRLVFSNVCRIIENIKRSAT